MTSSYFQGAMMAESDMMKAAQNQALSDGALREWFCPYCSSPPRSAGGRCPYGDQCPYRRKRIPSWGDLEKCSGHLVCKEYSTQSGECLKWVCEDQNSQKKIYKNRYDDDLWLAISVTTIFLAYLMIFVKK